MINMNKATELRNIAALENHPDPELINMLKWERDCYKKQIDLIEWEYRYATDSYELEDRDHLISETNDQIRDISWRIIRLVIKSQQ